MYVEYGTACATSASGVHHLGGGVRSVRKSGAGTLDRVAFALLLTRCATCDPPEMPREGGRWTGIASRAEHKYHSAGIRAHATSPPLRGVPGHNLFLSRIKVCSVTLSRVQPAWECWIGRWFFWPALLTQPKDGA